MAYKFQNLDVYKLALDYLDKIYEVVGRLPDSQKFNLSSQLARAATSLDIVRRRDYSSESELVEVTKLGHRLFVKLQAFRKALETPVPRLRSSVREER